MKTWKTVEIGATHEEIEEMISLIRKKGCKVSDDKRVKKMLFSTDSNSVKSKVKIVKIGIRSLLNNIHSERIEYKYILSRAKEIGLKPCPPEVGLQILLQDPKINCPEWINIGMEPVGRSILCVYPKTSCNRKPTLSGSNGEWDDIDEDCALMITKWVFIKE